MKKLLLFLGNLWSWLYPLWMAEKMNAVRCYLYTGYYKYSFKSFGRGSTVKPSFRVVRGLKYITVGDKTSIGTQVELTAWDKYKGQCFCPEIVIGSGVSIRDYSQVTAIRSIRIGNGVRTGPNVLITDNAHGASVAELLETAPNLRPLSSKGPVVIEDNVWIGTKSSIMPGVRIGRGSIIAANSVVTHDIPPYCVAAGAPARVVKKMN
jgi:acetyltransferase-like isoleucine patch superfamily enzyme